MSIKRLPFLLGTTVITTLLPLTSVGLVDVWAANLVGTPGPDTLIGTNSDDNIYGLGGNDNLNGRGGNDNIYGQDGRDTIDDGLGRDNVFAGSGDDTIKLRGTGEGKITGAQDVVYGESGKDHIDARNSEASLLLIYAGDDNDVIEIGDGLNQGTIYAGSGDDRVTTGDAVFDVYAGPGNDYLNGASECGIVHAFGEAGNDRIISPIGLVRGGDGDDYIEYRDCGGVAYGDAGNDELIGAGDDHTELHGGSGNDRLRAGISGDKLFGDSGDDTLIGVEGPTFFSCGPGIDTIIGFNPAEGDTKTADCENF